MIVRNVFLVEIEYESCTVISIFTTGSPTFRSVASAYSSQSSLDKNYCRSLIEDLVSKILFEPSIPTSFVNVDDSKVLFIIWEIANNFVILITVYYWGQGEEVSA